MRQLINRLLSDEDHPRYSQVVKSLWILLFTGIIAVCLLFIVLSFSDLPSVKQLENPRTDVATQVYGSNGKVIGRYYTQNRVPVSFEELDQNLINALIATEDERYYQHTGIDFQGLIRVIVKTILLRQESSGGASTITQQLAKQLFTGESARNKFVRAFQKFREWIIAVRLERKYTKEEIIALYLNKFDFLYQSFGIKAAAENYFNASQDSLEIHQAAMLVGMLKNPGLYNPRRTRTLTYAKKRREVVLKQMMRNKLLTQTEYDSIRQLPLGVAFQSNSHIDGIATYFRMELAKDLKEILSREEYLKSDGSSYDLYKDGLKIYTSIDPKMQDIAEKVMLRHMAERQKVFEREWRGKDPWTFVADPEEDIPVSIRQDGLKRLIRNTSRYQNLRQQYLGDLLVELRNRYPKVTFNRDDREIERIVGEAQNPGVIADLVQRGLISTQLAQGYRKVLRGNQMPALRTQWDKLQEAVKKEFDTPVEGMKVFTYENSAFEKDTTLTPLDSIKNHRMFLQTGIMAVDPQTGYAKVWIGGINQKYFQFDHVRTNRQVGSTFKPFVYATAIDQQGISPCFPVYDLKQVIRPGDGNFYLKEDWAPSNFDGTYTGELLTLKEGLRQSKNTVSVYLMKQLKSSDPVRYVVSNMGIDIESRYPNGQLRVPNVPSIALGATDLSVMEMTGAYTAFANNGIYTKPRYILRVEDKNGVEIYSSVQQDRQALRPNANFAMVDMLRYAGQMGVLKSDAGGKTGTTNDFVDGWFMGITPDLVVGTWVGGEDRWIHFRTPYNGQGFRMARPFFVNFIQELEKRDDLDYDPSQRFYRPPGDLGIELDCGAYQQEDIDMNQSEFEESSFGEGMFGDEFGIEDTTSIRQ
ncbi:MAG: transglycosylase domain-containing protein [Saprospiraceae bacterium]|nr:transglycosylase domain-containing protein [Saprospiraceae bacterium]